MKKKVALLLIVALMAMPVTVSAQEDWSWSSVDVKQMAIYNVMLRGMDFNESARILRINLIPKVNPWNYGLGLIIMKFNATTVPTNFSAYVTFPDNTTVPAISLLKNFTIENGEYLHHSGYIMNVRFLKLYFYQFLNHSTGPETLFWTAFDTGWNDSAWASQWPNYDPLNPYWDKFNRTYPTTPPVALAQDEEFDYEIVVDAQFNSGGIIPELPDGYGWIYGLGVGILVGFAVLVIVLYCQRKR
ncbi:MAG: hypothetical protein ACFFEA_13640 [Candidatus Thorarchaeota archaeon]